MVKKYAKRVLDTLMVYMEWVRLATTSHLYYRIEHIQPRKRHLALICWRFPPDISAGVYRPASLAKYARVFGWEISVVCGPLDTNPSTAGNHLLSSLPDNVKVERAKKSRLDPGHRLLPKLDGGFSNVFSLVSAARRLLENNPPSVVMATGPPFQTFVAGYYIARFFGAKMVFDYRDEWTQCPLDFVSAGIFDRIWEKRCLVCAEKCFFTTQSHLQQQLVAFPDIKAEKYRVIPNGWDPDDFFVGDSENSSDRKLNGYFLISYIGKLSDYALPGRFLADLKEVFDRRKDLLNTVRLSFVGSVSKNAYRELKEFAYNNVIEIVDHIPKALATLRMSQSSALLLINHHNVHRYRPGKLYEYLAAGPPVLVAGDGGEIASLIEYLEAGFVVRTGSEKSLENALDHLIFGTDIDWKKKRKEREGWLEQHTRKQSARNMFETFDSMLLM